MPEFDLCKEPLPQELNILLCLLDGAERPSSRPNQTLFALTQVQRGASLDSPAKR